MVLLLRRHGCRTQRVRRRSVYPAQWAWEVAEPFGHIQVDVKDIHAKGSLGTRHTTHLRRQHVSTCRATSGLPVMGALGCAFWPSATT